VGEVIGGRHELNSHKDFAFMQQPLVPMMLTNLAFGKIFFA